MAPPSQPARTHISTNTEDLQPPPTLRHRVQGAFRGLVERPVRALVRMGVGPNAVTIFGFALAVGSCALILLEWWAAAFAVFVIGSFSDMFDGSVARLSGKVTKFGAFLDSTLDRTAEGFVLGAIGVVFARDDDWWALGACFVALTASFLVSYTRARAEGIGIDSNRGGLMSRPERLFVIGTGLFFAPLEPALAICIYVLAALSTLTVAQRVYFVWRELRDMESHSHP